MSLRNGSVRTVADGKTKPVRPGKRPDEKSSESKNAGLRPTPRAHGGSAADRKMMRAWETLSRNRRARQGG
jgi:hypothetical protein